MSSGPHGHIFSVLNGYKIGVSGGGMAGGDRVSDFGVGGFGAGDCLLVGWGRLAQIPSYEM